jgi:DNA-binding GntR family transcriptional regulator
MERALASERRPQDWSAVFRADIDIHRSIARAARSPRLEKAMLEARGDFFVPVDLRSLEESDASVHDSHERILAAIKQQDAEAAAMHMRDHIGMIRGLTDKALEAAGIAPKRP